MTQKECVIHSLNHKETGIVPYHVDFTIQAFDRMVEHTRDPRFAQSFGTYLHSMQYWGWPTEIPEHRGFFTDAFDVTWNRSGVDKDIGVIDRPVIGEPDISLWRDPKLDETRLRAELQSILDTAGDRFAVAGIGFSMFERAWSLCGMENTLIYMLDEPAFVHDLLDMICEYNLRIIDIANEYPFDGFYFGDDWGQQRGLIMGPRLWREFIKPRMRRMYERAHKNNKYVIQHSCGDIHELFPDIIEIGLDCYQTFQPEIYDIARTKAEFGRDLTFWGGISTQRLLSRATPKEVKQETMRTMRIMGKGGGYIAAPTHAVSGDVPPENILAMMDVFVNQEKYLCTL